MLHMRSYFQSHHLQSMTFNLRFCVYVLVQSINDDLNASLATADELSREFSSLMQEATPAVQTTTAQVTEQD